MMMDRLFDTLAEIAVLEAEAIRWERTPFFKGSRAKGTDGGVDCVNLMCALVGVGGMIIPPLPADYPLDHTYHNASSLIEIFIEEAGLQEHFSVTETVVPGDLKPGDILHFRMENDVNHLAMVLGGRRVINCLNPHGVRIVRLEVVMRFGDITKGRTPLKMQ